MSDFNFHKPSSLEEAVKLVSSAEDGKFLAGGQSLLPVIKMGMAEPTDLVSLAGIKDFSGIVVDGDKLLIGGGATHASVAMSAQVMSHSPGLARLASQIGDAQVRNRGTIGGSLAHADPASDYPAAVLALNATIVTHKREIAADDFFQGLFETALDEAEIIKAVRFPKVDRAAYAKFPNPASKYPVVGVMVAKVGGDVRVAVTGAGVCAFRVPDMEAALARDFSAVAIDGIAVAADDLNDDQSASADYRAHLISVMAQRAVAAAAA